MSGGERGIRTLDTLLTYTPLAGERFRPLSHLSELTYKLQCNSLFNKAITKYLIV